MSDIEEIKEEFGEFFILQNDSLWKQKMELESGAKSVRPSIKGTPSKSHKCLSKSLPATFLRADTRSEFNLTHTTPRTLPTASREIYRRVYYLQTFPNRQDIAEAPDTVRALTETLIHPEQSSPRHIRYTNQIFPTE